MGRRAAGAAGMMGRKSSAGNGDMAKVNPLQEQLLKAGLVDGNTGAGSSWEPRVADPRGRAFTLMATYKFF